MTPKIRSALFFSGLVLFVVSFLLPALIEENGVNSGFTCAVDSVLVSLTVTGDLLRGMRLPTHSLLATICVLLTVWINPLFLIYAVASPFRPADRTVRICRIVIPLLIPLCWVIFADQGYHPRVGLFVWIAGILLVIASRFTTQRSTQPTNQFASN